MKAEAEAKALKEEVNSEKDPMCTSERSRSGDAEKVTEMDENCRGGPSKPH